MSLWLSGFLRAVALAETDGKGIPTAPINAREMLPSLPSSSLPAVESKPLPKQLSKQSRGSAAQARDLSTWYCH